MNMVKTLDKQITISHAQRADAPQGMPSAWEADPIHLFIRFFVSLQQPKPYSSISKLRNSVKKRPCSSLVILTSISRLSILIRPAENSSSV